MFLKVYEILDLLNRLATLVVESSDFDPFYIYSEVEKSNVKSSLKELVLNALQEQMINKDNSKFLEDLSLVADLYFELAE